MSNIPNYEVPAEMRDFAEKSVDQARKAFDSFIGAARRTADTVQGSTEVARTNAQDVSARGFEYPPTRRDPARGRCPRRRRTVCEVCRSRTRAHPARVEEVQEEAYSPST